MGCADVPGGGGGAVSSLWGVRVSTNQRWVHNMYSSSLQYNVLSYQEHLKGALSCPMGLLVPTSKCHHSGSAPRPTPLFHSRCAKPGW